MDWFNIGHKSWEAKAREAYLVVINNPAEAKTGRTPPKGRKKAQCLHLVFGRSSHPQLRQIARLVRLPNGYYNYQR